MSGDDKDLPRDAHLRAALRHAPDREAAPPPALSATILDAARAQTARGRATPGGGWGARLRDRLAALGRALAQPAAGAAFASLTLATVIGLMWQDGPPPEARPGGPPAAPAPVVDAAPKDEPAKPALAEAHVEPPAAVEPAPPAAAPPARPPARDRAAAPPRRAEAPTVVATAPAVEPAPARAAPPTDTAAESPAGAAPPAALGLPKSTAPAPALESSASAAADDAAGADPLAAALGRPGAAATLDRLGASAARERRSLAADTLGPATRAWLQDARSKTQGRWQRSEQPLPPDALPVLAADGSLLGRLVFDPDALRWQPAATDAPVWRAPLAPEVLARLRAGWAARQP